MPRSTKITIGIVLVIVVVLSFGIGFISGNSLLPSSGGGLDTIEEAWNIIFTQYVDRDKLDAETLKGGAITGMIEALDDPYSSYLDARHLELGLSSLEGEFNGIGAYVSMENDQLVIVSPIAGSPAEKAGILAGDIIMSIDGVSVADMSLAEAIIKIRGPEGTQVNLLILHEGETAPVEITVTRGRVELESVRSEMKENMAHIIISQFSERTASELAPILAELPENTEGIILDLRGNPGGLLDSVVNVASYFLREGAVVSVRSNEGDISTLNVIPGKPVTDLPMVVLVNSSSASGSEVLAGALQDHDRAVITGNTTFGKGSVNVLRQLSDGSGIYITTARWLTPDGRLIEGKGIEPDFVIDLSGDDAVQWAIDYLKNRS